MIYRDENSNNKKLFIEWLIFVFVFVFIYLFTVCLKICVYLI